MEDDLSTLPAYIKDSRLLFETWLSRLVAIPTVSSDPAHDPDITKGVASAVRLLETFGLSTTVVETGGNPIVVGTLLQDPAYSTILVYNHMDVQPASGEWGTDPFILTRRGNDYIGRGATDDKGPALTVLFAIKYARSRRIPLNFKVVWEFEEEIGSPHFDEFVKTHRKELAAESVVVSDTVWLSDDKPVLSIGLRGLLTFELYLQTGVTDVHSGMAGGPTRNPIAELAQIICECYDAKSGHVHISGFYDGVRPVSSDELQTLRTSGFSVQKFMQDLQLFSLRSQEPIEVQQSIMLRPTFEVHSIAGGYTGTGIKTVIPSSATAKLSVRLVPDQRPTETFQKIKRFIQNRNPDITVRRQNSCEPYLAKLDGPYLKAAEIATHYAFAAQPALVREGGSIGSVMSMSAHLQVPILLLGISLPKHGYHAPNEHFDWQQAAGGIKLFAKYFSEIAKIS